MKVYLAGMESRVPYFDVMEKFPPFVMQSVEKSKAQRVVNEARQRGVDSIMIDSGAFTFLNSRALPIDRLASFVERYIDFINRNSIELYLELDIDKLIGYEKVITIRKRLERETGKPCIPVWHRTRGKQRYLEMLDEYRYVAIGGLFDIRWKKGLTYLSWFVKEAAKRRVKLHLLGIQNQKLWEQLAPLGLYSVDFSGWIGERWGTVSFIDKDGKWKVRRPNRGERLKWGKNATRGLKEEIVRQNARTAVRLVEIWRKRGYDDSYFA